MKPDIHPVSRYVVFRDRAGGAAFLIRSTLDSEKTVVWEDGSTYPVVDVEVSSASHPFYTGAARVMDTAGRVERFERRYARRADTGGEAGEGDDTRRKTSEGAEDGRRQ